jgi:phosphatidylserine/phosphatidylglycerophosphate/cardiolipin synthase-like enzyme
MILIARSRRRTCHEATIKRLTENKRTARARDQKKDDQIKELQAPLLALQQATEQRLSEMEMREKNIAAREADVQKVERRQAQVERYLDDKEKKFHQDRIALEQLRYSIAIRAQHTPNDSSQGLSASCIRRASHNSTCASISEVSIELAGCISVSSSASSHQEPASSCSVDATESWGLSATAQHSERNAIRRRAHTGHLHRRYAPEFQFQ